MRELLEHSFFPYVTKPGRYAGGEPGQCRKDPSEKLLYLHACPDIYEAGQCSGQLQSLYHIVNSVDYLACERAFGIEPEAARLMREKSIPLFSLESSRAASEFDIIGLFLDDPMKYADVLTIIDLAGLPLKSADRSDDHPLLLGLGPVTSYPEPVADFFDLFLIGEAEERLPEILTTLHGCARKKITNSTIPRARIPHGDSLNRLVSEVSSIYVPSFYDSEKAAMSDFVPQSIKIGSASELRSEFYPSRPLLPLIDVRTSKLCIEMSRATWHCADNHFIPANSHHVRTRTDSSVRDQVERQLTHTGYDEVQLASVSEADSNETEMLVSSLSLNLSPDRIKLDLEKIIPGSVTSTTLDALGRVHKSRLSLLIAAGSERLRLLLGYQFSSEAFFDTVRMIFGKGWKSIRVLCYIGLPTEDENDLRAITSLVKQVDKIGIDFGAKRNIILELIPFLPAPHTPFQWDAAASVNELKSKVSFIRKNLRLNNLQLKFDYINEVPIKCALTRGGRELAPVIVSASRFLTAIDSVSDIESLAQWKSAFAEHKIDPIDYLTPVSFSRKLPWSHICSGITNEQLALQRRNSSYQIAEFTPPEVIKAESSQEKNVSGFGRNKKRLASKTVSAPTRNRVRMRWGKERPYRYMSHLDNLRLLERCIRMASLPIAYSQGQSPSMKLSLGPPLPLGFTSEAEYLDLILEVNLTSDMLARFQKVLPEGIELHDARSTLGSGPSLSATINRALYTLPLSLWSDTEKLQEQLTVLLQQETIPIERISKNKTKIVDLRSGIYDLRINAEAVEFTLGIGDGGFVRPGEVANLISDSLSVDIPALPFHRKQLYHQDSTNMPLDPMNI